MLDPPKDLPPRHAIAVSCGRKDNQPELDRSQPTQPGLEALCFDPDKHVVRLDVSPWYLLTSKQSTDVKNPRNVYDAVSEALERVSKDDFTFLHLALPSSAGSLSDVYVVSPVHTFIETVHAFADWRAKAQSKKPLLKLRLYTVQQEVQLNLSSHRIDIEELLTSPRVRFLSLLCPGPKIEPVRRVLYYGAKDLLGDVFRDLRIPCQGDTDEWFASIYPSPRRRGDEPGAPIEQSTASLAQKNIRDAGIAYGSLLTIRRKEPTAFRRQRTTAAHMRVEHAVASPAAEAARAWPLVCVLGAAGAS